MEHGGNVMLFLHQMYLLMDTIAVNKDGYPQQVPPSNQTKRAVRIADHSLPLTAASPLTYSIFGAW